jgi:pantetheine-phosphate adenylyltransferase
MTIALYPGSFDPITNGHIDIVSRAAYIFDKVIMGAYEVPQKNLLFSTEERLGMMRQAVAHLPNVQVMSYSILTTEFVRKINAKVIVRGLRMSGDFEREFDMAITNRRIAPDIDTICFMSRLEYQFLSSSLLKEVAQLGGPIGDLVPEHVAAALSKKFGRVSNLGKGEE